MGGVWQKTSGEKNRHRPADFFETNVYKNMKPKADTKNKRQIRVLEVVPRPDAPYELDDEQADIWRAIINSLPADHFIPSNFHLLVRLCKHIAAGRRLDRLIEIEMKKKKVDEIRLAKFMAMRARETSAIRGLSRDMRLTQQSVYLPQTAARRIKGVTSSKANLIDNPWFKGEGDDDDADNAEE